MSGHSCALELGLAMCIRVLVGRHSLLGGRQLLSLGMNIRSKSFLTKAPAFYFPEVDELVSAFGDEEHRL